MTSSRADEVGTRLDDEPDVGYPGEPDADVAGDAGRRRNGPGPGTSGEPETAAEPAPLLATDEGFWDDAALEARAVEREAATADAGIEHRPATTDREPERVRFRWGRDFVDQPIERHPALLGRDADVLVPAGGLVLVGGIGGAGKSTLTLHAIAHLGSGVDWLGIHVGRALRIGVIENEGPKEPYIDKLKRFADAWDGPDFLANCAFHDSPWGRFSLADEGLRGELRAFAVQADLDLIVAGPVGRLGIKGVGSPEEVRDFINLLADVGCGRDVAFWLLHHLNKTPHRSIVQQLSGDWGGHPDLILGLEQENKRRTKLTFAKVRWGDQGREPLILDWLLEEEGIGYTIVPTGEHPDIDWAELRTKVRSAVELHPGASQRKVEEHAGGKRAHVREALQRLERDGEIENRGGPNRKAFHLVTDPAQEELGWS